MALSKKPNFLIITTDEQRFPPCYESEATKKYRLENAKAQGRIAQHGMSFNRHYTASTACAPSRTTIYTGQYPSLHGVSQTPGIGKSSYDQNMFWLEPNTVPTLGNWFQAAGYQTHWRGKWHISFEDIDIPGTQTSLFSNDANGEPYPERIALYREANRLKNFGFDGWIGPEPHGSAQNNTATNRDPGFARQTVALLEQLDQAFCNDPDGQDPFLVVCSFVNPHDIVLYPAPWFPNFQAAVDNGELPEIPPAPTQAESLQTKPRCQQDYIYKYPRMLLPQPPSERLRRFYYYLMAEVDGWIDDVYGCLERCSFFDNTIVLFTSDHGEMLGAHGGMHQKWYNAYEEILRVPFTVSNPSLFPQPQVCDSLTSHIDILPTLLGLAGADVNALSNKLKQGFSEVHPFVGRDLSAALLNQNQPNDGVVYFMTDDNVENGDQMFNPLTGRPYTSIVQPNHLETVVARLEVDGASQLWKFTHYFDNPRFDDANFGRVANAGIGNPDEIVTDSGIPSEFEAYNLDEDPMEQDNRMSPYSQNPVPAQILAKLEALLAEQRQQKRKFPTTTDADASTDIVVPYRN